MNENMEPPILPDTGELSEEELAGAIDQVKRPRILVGITNYADTEHLDMLLQSIRWYTYIKEDYEIFVVDDGTRHMSFEAAQRRNINPIEMADKTMEVCARYGAIYMEHEKNLGIPSAWNSLCDKAHAGTEIMVVLNNDLLMVPNWLKVIAHFLDANKDNPHVGSCYFNPIQPFPKEDMRAILPNLAHTLYHTTDQLSGQLRVADQLASSGVPRVESGEGAGQGLGRVMCPAGCSFAFTKKVWEKVGPFDTRLTSFHEESDWGTRCASMGMASFGFAYPRPYHAHGFTFGVSPELEADHRMRASRKLYRQIWEVPEGVGPHEYFNYTNAKYMSQIPPVTVKFLQPVYPPEAEPEENILVGGEKILTPHLREVEQTYEYQPPA